MQRIDSHHGSQSIAVVNENAFGGQMPLDGRA